MKRVLVTGATGFVGRHSLTPLIERGFDVTAVASHAFIESHPSVKWVRADLMDPVKVAEVMTEVSPTHLLHFAWYAEPGKFWTDRENFRWVQASLRLLEEFARCGGTRIVSAGTCAEYDWNHGYCIESLTPLLPNTVYGVCKRSFEAMQSIFCAQAGMSSAWGRIFFLYGPHEHPKRLVSSVILSLLRDEPARCSHGRQIRDFLHVSDVANAFVSLLASEVEGAVNIGSGQPVALKEVVQAIARRLGREDRVQYGAIAAANDPPLLLANTRRLMEDVSWSPYYNLESGLEQTIAWWQKQQAVELDEHR